MPISKPQIRIPFLKKVRRNKWVFSLIALFWLFLYVGTASNIWYTQVRNEEVIEYGVILIDTLFFWGIAAFFSTVIYRLTQQFPLDGNFWMTTRNAAIHAVGCITFLFADTITYRVIASLIHNSSQTLEILLDPAQWLQGVLEMGMILFCVYCLIVIGVHLNRFYKRYKQKQLITARLEAELSSASLNVLKNQLRPHFLFNTLHNINSLMHNKPTDAKKVISLLQRLLKRSFRRTELQTVTLAEELDFTNIYFKIENIRYYDGLNIKRNIDSKTLQAQVPSLLLQPLAENAVRHGIAKRAAMGTIYLGAKKVNQKLQLVVEDDGPGMKDTQTAFGNGIGLNNTRQRLKQMYKNHRFELGQSDYGGLKVLIEIPFYEN